MQERLGHLPEQELAKHTHRRIQTLAQQSGFSFTGDPQAFAVFRKQLSLYKDPGRDVVIAVLFSEGVNPMPWSGSVTFTEVIVDPIDSNKFIRSGSRNKFLYFTDGERRTVFRDPDSDTDRNDHEIGYPKSDENDYMPQVDDDERSAAMTDRLREEFESILLDQPLRSRKPKAVEESRVRLLELNVLLDKRVPERDLIKPPGV